MNTHLFPRRHLEQFLDLHSCAGAGESAESQVEELYTDLTHSEIEHVPRSGVQSSKSSTGGFDVEA